jgi:hypothetical protein
VDGGGGDAGVCINGAAEYSHAARGGGVRFSMMRTIFWLLILGLTVPAVAAEHSAADVYGRAFELIEKLDDADAGRLGLCGKDGCWVVTTPLDAATDRLLGAQREAVELARKGSKLGDVRWGLDGDAGRMVRLMNRGPQLSALLVLQARQSLKAGKAGEAVDDLVAALALSRQLAAEPMLVTKMAEFAAARPARELLARELPGLPKEVVAGLPERLAKLPASPGLDATIRGEYAFAKRTAAKQGIMAVAMVDGMAEVYELMAASADKPPAEFDKLLDGQVEKLPLNPWIKVLAPALKRHRENAAATDAKWAMLLAAIDVTLHGEGALARSTDPVDGRPFELRRLKGGYELVGRTTFRDEPVKLVVGQ